MKFEYAEPNEWREPIRKGYKMCCCDCGLVHEMDFRVRKGHIEFRVRHSNRSTGQVRRWMRQREINPQTP